jgi:hypothetical protein
LPAKLVEPALTGDYVIDPLEYRHPIVAPFRDDRRAGLLSTPIHKYVRLRPIEAAHARVALAVASRGSKVQPDEKPPQPPLRSPSMNDAPGAMPVPDGRDPIIVEAPAGRGRVVLFATAASLASLDDASGRPWTYWPVWPSFLPVVQESLRLAVRGRWDHHNVIVGQPLCGVAPGAALGTELPLAVTGPDGVRRVERAPCVVDGNQTQWTVADTSVSGVYHVGPESVAPESVAPESVAPESVARAPSEVSGPASEEPYAVNVDTSESDLARLDPRELPEDPAALGDRPKATLSRRQGLFDRLLLAAALLMLTETCLAWWLGRRWS